MGGEQRGVHWQGERRVDGHRERLRALVGRAGEMLVAGVSGPSQRGLGSLRCRALQAQALRTPSSHQSARGSWRENTHHAGSITQAGQALQGCSAP